MESGRNTLYQSLKAIFLHIDNREKALFSKYDLSVARFYTLMHVHNHPGITYIDLSDLMLCTKSNTTRVVRGLLVDGWVSRKAHPIDGRSYQLYLTKKGKSLYNTVQPVYLSHIDKLMSSFNNEELAEYTEVSQHIENT
ncbi:MAG: MarR family transcriptional regulator, partial [Chloroflexota bacterium]